MKTPPGALVASERGAAEVALPPYGRWRRQWLEFPHFPKRRAGFSKKGKLLGFSAIQSDSLGFARIFF
jgi:hypothetical protein